MMKNRAALFWSLAFPICVSFLAFMVLDPSSAFFGNVQVFVSDEDDSEFSQAYVNNIRQFSSFVDAVDFEIIDLEDEDAKSLTRDPESVLLTIHDGHSEAIYSGDPSRIVIEVGEFERAKSSAVAGILLSLDSTATAAVLNGLTSNISAKVVGVDYGDANFGAQLTAQLIIISIFPVFIYGIFVVSVGHRESGIVRSILLYPINKLIPILAIVCSRISYSFAVIILLATYFLMLFEINFFASGEVMIQVFIVFLAICIFFSLTSLLLAILIDNTQLAILVANSIYLMVLLLSGLIPIPLENLSFELFDFINPIKAAVDLLVMARDYTILDESALIRLLTLIVWSTTTGIFVFCFKDQFFRKIQ